MNFNLKTNIMEKQLLPKATKEELKNVQPGLKRLNQIS